MNTDADGSCAITQLLILQKFMEVLARKLDVALVGIHPTDFFRLIGGIGYGGYVKMLNLYTGSVFLLGMPRFY